MGWTIYRAPHPKVTAVTDTNQQLLLFLCCASQGCFADRTFHWYTKVSTSLGQCKEQWKEQCKCIAYSHNQNPCLRGIFRNYTFHWMIYLTLGAASSKETIMLLLQLSQFPSPQAQQLRPTHLVSPLSCSSVPQTWKIKGAKKGKGAHQLSFHRGGNRRSEEGEPL